MKGIRLDNNIKIRYRETKDVYEKPYYEMKVNLRHHRDQVHYRPEFIREITSYIFFININIPTLGIKFLF